MQQRLTLSLLTASLCACSGNSLLTGQQRSFQVDSVPVGASVLVLGEAMGQTPLTLHTRDVFPQSYAHDKQHLYGRVEIRHPGCKTFTTTVSSRIISHGLNARLECDEKPTAPPAAQVEQQTAPLQRQQPQPLKQRLIRLKELYQEGLISEPEYEAKRKQLLEEL